MPNQAMRRKWTSGRAIDVSLWPRDEDGAYVVPENAFVEGKDYCNLQRQEWIWSIGRRKRDGVTLAAHDGRFYQNDDYECLWLR